MAEFKVAPTSAKDAMAAKPPAHRRPSQALDRVLARLCRALQRAPRELRHQSLQMLKPRVQAVLLVFMESREELKSKGAPIAKAARGSGGASASADRQSGALICLGRLYRAQGFILNLRILTVAVRERLRAKAFQRVLTLAREVVLARVAKGAELDEQIVMEAFRSACLEQGMDLEALGLAFRAEVSGRPYLKRDVWGRYSQDVSQALLDRNKLLRAKAESWRAFRTAWISVLQSPCFVRNSAPRGWARHRDHTALEAEAIVDMAARKQCCPWKRAKRRVEGTTATAAQLIAFAAEAVERKLAAQERHVCKTVELARRRRTRRRGAAVR